MGHSSRLLTLARDLRRRKARERTQYFVAEGIRTVEELLQSTLEIRGVLAGPALASTTRGEALRGAVAKRGIELLDVTEAEFDSSAETESPQGILALAEIPRRTLSDIRDAADRVLALDAVQDPGNVGTMLRSAGALGVAATVALPGTVDLWNAKVVRSAAGTHFSHLAIMANWTELDGWRASRDVTLWGADARGEPLSSVSSATPRRLAIVVGNEGSGLTTTARDRCARFVSVPVSGVGSLNVSVAAGILLYELRR